MSKRIMCKNNSGENLKSQTLTEFIDLLTRNIESNPENIQPVSRSLSSEFKLFAIRQTPIVVASSKKTKLA